jgi:hypothetical protein
MRKDKKPEKKPRQMKKRKKLAARIPITEWYDIERKMAIIARMSGA